MKGLSRISSGIEGALCTGEKSQKGRHSPTVISYHQWKDRCAVHDEEQDPGQWLCKDYDDARNFLAYTHKGELDRADAV